MAVKKFKKNKLYTDGLGEIYACVFVGDKVVIGKATKARTHQEGEELIFNIDEAKMYHSQVEEIKE